MVKADDDLQGRNTFLNRNKLHFDIDELKDDNRRFARQEQNKSMHYHQENNEVATSSKKTTTTLKTTEVTYLIEL